MNRHDIVVANIPVALRELPRWVCWRVIERGGKPTKCPVCAVSGVNADSTDPTTWTTFNQAVSAFQNNNALAGIGFVLASDDGLCGVDLDDSIDPDSGQLKQWAREIIDSLDSYTEISPSGGGVKIFLRASKPGERCRKKHHDGEVEMYDAGRFFTVTGRRLDCVSADIENRQAQLEEVFTMVFGEAQPAATQPPPKSNEGATPPALADDEIVSLAAKGRKNGTKFSALWDGRWNDYFNSASEADSSLVFMLAFYTKDAVQIDRLFRRSQLYRPKWDEVHGTDTYGRTTIVKALEHVTEQYRPRKRRTASGTPDASAPSADQPIIPLGQRDPQSNRLVLSSRRTMPTAEAYFREFHSHPDGRTMHNYAGLLMAWQDNRYCEVEDEAIKNRLQPWLHDALQYVLNRRTQALDLVPFESNAGTIKSALDSIRTFSHLPASLTPPAWIGDHDSLPDAREVLTCRTLNLHIPTGRVFPASPALFATNALEFDYDPEAPVPDKWLAFLRQLWGDDDESIQLLQEWFGYCLTADTSQQKMLMLVGPKRSGKGTIGRVLQRLVGAANVAGPTTRSLAGTFGLQPLIGKSLAIVSDARFSGPDVMIVVERLLCVSGEDALTIDRKHIGAVTMKLPTRFVFLTNELPRFADASAALAGRFMILQLTRSFYGREDHALSDRLLSELPGILLWALQGWERLRQRGRFIQPQSVSDTIRDLEDLSSPVGAFVRDRCVVGGSHRVLAHELYDAWKEWCEQEGRSAVTTRQVFGRDLAASVPGIVCRQGTMGYRFYQGIALRGEAEGADG